MCVYVCVCVCMCVYVCVCVCVCVCMVYAYVFAIGNSTAKNLIKLSHAAIRRMSASTPLSFVAIAYLTILLGKTSTKYILTLIIQAPVFVILI